jgi:IS1 family transposase
VNVLPREKRIAVLAALVEGNSERAVERLTGVNRETVGRLNLAFGEGAQRLHDRMARALSCVDIECDEAWSFCQVKEARVRPDHAPGSGEAYVYVGLDKPSRFVITWHVGKRDAENARAFIADMRTRLTVMPQIVTDGFAPYVAAVGAEFGLSVDFAQTVKNYRSSGRRDDHRYEPPRDPFITKKIVYGSPDLDTASTAYIERNNGTMRAKIGRMRRLSYAFSKKAANHRAACALNYCAYNLTWVVRTLRVTPAMAVGITNHVWDMAELHDAITAEVAPVEKPKAQPLTHRTPPGPARELPGGRGFLRLVAGGAEPPKGPGIVAAPGPRPAPAQPSSPVALAPEPTPRWTQLELFGTTPKGGKDENQPE